MAYAALCSVAFGMAGQTLNWRHLQNEVLEKVSGRLEPRGQACDGGLEAS